MQSLPLYDFRLKDSPEAVVAAQDLVPQVPVESVAAAVVPVELP